MFKLSSIFTVLLFVAVIQVTPLPLQAGTPTDEPPPLYRWPLDFNNGFSRSFQEFGPTHFHAGMDLRTLQKTGFPVYAIADGKVYKIRVVKRGSGRGLYLKHDDGYTSIYFHLEKFAPQLEAILKEVQKDKKKKYIGNYFLKQPIPFKKGELLAYSGETGAGYPHLHIEIRDPQYFAVNPFPLVKFPKKDTNFPVLKGILLRNRGDATINGQIEETFLKFISARSHGFTISEPLLVTGGEGSFEPVLNVFDIADTGKHVAPQQVTGYIDGQRYFHLLFNRFQGDDNNQLGFVYDMNYSGTTSYFFNLFFQEGYQLEEEKVNLDHLLAGILPGKHELTLEVKDYHHNRCTARIPFVKLPAPLLKISQIVKSGQGLGFNIDRLVAPGVDRIEIKLLDHKQRLLYNGALAAEYYKIDKKLPLLLKKVSSGSTYMDFIFYKEGNVYFKKRFLVNPTHLDGMSNISFDTFINRDDIYITVDEPGLTADNLELRVIQGKETMDVPAHASADKIFFRFKPRGFENHLSLRFRALDKGQLQAEIQKKIEIIHLQEGEKQTFTHGNFQGVFYQRAVYEPKVLLVEEKQYASDYPIESKEISLSPFHFPFLDTVYFKFTKKLDNPQQVGIFQYHQGRKTWYSVYTTYDPVSHTFQARRIAPGIFALMRDEFRPTISLSRTRTKYLDRLDHLRVIIRDKGKGVNDNSLRITLNGKRLDCEYDPDRASVTIEDLDALQRGENNLSIRVKDYAGNLASKSYRFSLQ